MIGWVSVPGGQDAVYNNWGLQGGRGAQESRLWRGLDRIDGSEVPASPKSPVRVVMSGVRVRWGKKGRRARYWG